VKVAGDPPCLPPRGGCAHSGYPIFDDRGGLCSSPFERPEWDVLTICQVGRAKWASPGFADNLTVVCPEAMPMLSTTQPEAHRARESDAVSLAAGWVDARQRRLRDCGEGVRLS
jgi:hypothetical protein